MVKKGKKRAKGLKGLKLSPEAAEEVDALTAIYAGEMH
jgi:hypothetical protein